MRKPRGEEVEKEEDNRPTLSVPVLLAHRSRIPVDVTGKKK